MEFRAMNKEFTVNREIEELSLLWEVSQALGSSMNLREVVGPVLSALAERMGMTRGTLTLLNRMTGEIYIDAAHGLSENEKRRGRYKIGDGITSDPTACRTENYSTM